MKDVIPSPNNFSWLGTHVAKVGCKTRHDGPCRNHAQLYSRVMLNGGGACVSIDFGHRKIPRKFPDIRLETLPWVLHLHCLF